MASQKTQFTVGLFVASGIGLALIAVVWLGMSRFLEKGRFYVTYFNESVQGLDKDSPVKYRGVSVGRVDYIGVAPDSKLIQVVLKIESGQTLENDIVAQLKAVGITGSMFIELDRKNPGEPDRSPALNFPTEYPIVASKPSEISELLHGIDEVLTQIRSLDLAGISERTKETLDTIHQKIDQTDIKLIAENLNRTLEKASKGLDSVATTFSRVEAIVSQNQETITSTLSQFRDAVGSATVFLNNSSLLVRETDESLSDLKLHLMTVAQNLEGISEKTNRLLETLADQPSQLIFGQPPQPRAVEPAPPLH